MCIIVHWMSIVHSRIVNHLCSPLIPIIRTYVLWLHLLLCSKYINIFYTWFHFINLLSIIRIDWRGMFICLFVRIDLYRCLLIFCLRCVMTIQTSDGFHICILFSFVLFPFRQKKNQFSVCLEIICCSIFMCFAIDFYLRLYWYAYIENNQTGAKNQMNERRKNNALDERLIANSAKSKGTCLTLIFVLLVKNIPYHSFSVSQWWNDQHIRSVSIKMKIIALI